MEHFAVKFQIIFSGTILCIFCPKRMCIIYQLGTFFNTNLLFKLFGIAVSILFILFLGFNFFYHFIRRKNFLFFYDFRIGCLVFSNINFIRHECTVFFDNFFCFVFITELEAVFIYMQGNLCTNLLHVTVSHIKLCTTITFPVNRCCSCLIRQRININCICNHKCRIKAQTKVSDNLIFICFIFIL